MKRLTLLPLLLVLGCGDAGSSDGTRLGTGGGASEGVELQGNIAAPGPDTQKLLVFAYANLGGKGPAAAGEPASLSAVSADRSFVLSGVPAGDVTILFLIDAKSDGVIDPGDSIATLEDAERQLTGLKPGDAVWLQDVAIDPVHGKAKAGTITVKRAGAPAAEATGEAPAGAS